MPGKTSEDTVAPRDGTTEARTRPSDDSRVKTSRPNWIDFLAMVISAFLRKQNEAYGFARRNLQG